MYRQYTSKQYNRKHYSNVTLQLPVTELQELNDLAYRLKWSHHAILYSAFRKGLPQVVENLEARARPADQAKLNNGQG